MCGIIGLIDYNNGIDSNTISKMINSIHHRGPNGSNFFLSENKHIFLGHTRLSIIDLKDTGSQPFISNSKNYVMTYNGEIYNFKKIKKDLNFSFGKIKWRGQSDTEVLINAIEHLGIFKTLSLIRGMYAFALLDKKKNLIYLVRDNVGEKPLYYGFNEGKFYFGSDLIAFESNKDFKRNIDRSVLDYYFKYNYIGSPKSIYSNIYKLLPGNILTLDLNKIHLQDLSIKVQEHWSLNKIKEKKSIINNYNFQKKNVKEILTNSVEEQLLSSDTETSVMLSSGIDSSLVTSIASKIKKNLSTYSLGFSYKKFDETGEANKIAQYLNTNHNHFKMDGKNALEMCQNISKSYSEPFADSSQLATLFLASKISKNHKVVLTGDGGDEMFGGYDRYVQYKKISNLFFLLKFDKKKYTYQVFNYLNNNNILPKLKNINHFKRILDSTILSNNNSEFFDNLISHKSANLYSTNNSNKILNQKFINSAIDLMKKDFQTYLPEDLLVKMDRACMFYGVENRSPFLNQDLINYVFSEVSIKSKIKKNIGKYILKDILNDYLPKSLITKNKKGFLIPLKEWLINDLNEWANELIKPDKLNNFEEFNCEKIIYLWKNLKNLSYFEIYALWDVIIFQNWYYRGNV